MKKVLVLSFLMLLAIQVLGQSEYKAGYIVNPPGDTLRGYLLYQGITENEQGCSFKTQESASASIYTAEQILAYGIDGDRVYKSISIFGNGANTKVFAQVILEGKITLLKRSQFFYLEKEGAIYVLRSGRGPKTDDDNKAQAVRASEYKRTLKLVLKDCEDFTLIQRVDKIAFSEPALISILEDYHNCASSGYTLLNQNRLIPKYIFSPGFFVALNTSTPKIGNENNILRLVNQDFSSSLGINIGALLHFSMPRWSEKLGFTGELSYFSNNYETSLEINQPALLWRNNLSFKARAVKLGLGLQYDFKYKDFTPYLGANLNYYAAGSSSSTQNAQAIVGGANPQRGTENVEGFVLKNSWFSSSLGFGIKQRVSNHSKFFAELRYEISFRVASELVVFNAIVPPSSGRSGAGILNVNSRLSGFYLMTGFIF